MELFDKSISVISSQAIYMKSEISELFKKKEFVDSINNSLEFKLKEYKTQKIQIEKENSLYEEKIIELDKILKNNLENKEKEKYEKRINSFRKGKK